MKIALDYDGTYTLSPDFWDDFISQAVDYGHDIRIVTFRHPSQLDDIDPEIGIPIIATGFIRKRTFCSSIEWFPDIWIDDEPELIVE